MAMMLNKTGGKGGRRRRKAMQSEINVTPFVDVMLVLLIVFMVTAPLLATGIDVALPDARAKQLLQPEQEVLSITIQKDGKMFLQKEEITMQELLPKLRAIVATGYNERLYVRGDKDILYGDGVRVMAAAQMAGFNHIALVADPNAS